MKMYDPTTTNSLIKASMATRCVPGGQMATMRPFRSSSKASASSGVSEIIRAHASPWTASDAFLQCANGDKTLWPKQQHQENQCEQHGFLERS